jgi:hypothetical protein
MAAFRAMRCKHSPNGGIQWPLVKLTRIRGVMRKTRTRTRSGIIIHNVAAASQHERKAWDLELPFAPLLKQVLVHAKSTARAVKVKKAEQ